MNEPMTPGSPPGGDGVAKTPTNDERAERVGTTRTARPRTGGPGTSGPPAGSGSPAADRSAGTSASDTATRPAGPARSGGTGEASGSGASTGSAPRKRRRRGGRGRGRGNGGGGNGATAGSNAPSADATSAGGTKASGGSSDGKRADGTAAKTANGGAAGSSTGSAPAPKGTRTDGERSDSGRSRSASTPGATGGRAASVDDVGREPGELPKPAREGRASASDAERALVRTPGAESGGGAAATAGRPRIGDTRPAPTAAPDAKGGDGPSGRSRSGRGQGGTDGTDGTDGAANPARKRRRRGGRGRSSGKGNAKVAQGREPTGVRSGVAKPVTALTGGGAVELDEDVLNERRGETRNGKPVGRYLMAVHVQADATHIAILEGRSLIEHYVARPADDIAQIHGNIYLGRVQNVLPGMEAAFVDIGTPKNAVLYRGDLHFDAEDIEERDNARIEQILKARQTVLCQVTKNPIMHKGARLTQEVSLPGRFVVLVPNSRTVGISKRLPDAERKRLRKIIDKHRPEGHGVIVRTAAESITEPEIERDLARLVSQWEKIEALAAKASAPALLYREPDMALRVIREEFSKDFRSVVIDDQAIYEDVREYVASVSPALAERVVHFDRAHEDLPLFERHHIAEQLHRALDRKVWLPSGGSLIIEHTEALTVIDVNTGKNVGKSNLEDTVFDNNLEAAVEIARQLRLRDVGGIIVIDFVDMEVKKNRAEVVRVFREALARDKTRTQVFDISELGLVQMTRKRIGEGLLESFSEPCKTCSGRGVVFDEALFEA